MAAFWIWIGSAACSAGVLFGEPGPDRPRHTALALGLIFAAYAMSAYWVAGRLRTLSATVVVCWGTAFGLWFPVWHERVGEWAAAWMPFLSAVDFASTERLQWPIAVCGAGWATAVMLFIATGSGRVVAQTALLSLVAAMASLVPWRESLPAMLGIVAWHAGVAASLCRAAVDTVRGGAGLACWNCGRDTAGLSSPVCPGCGRRLTRAAVAATPLFATHR